jgi:hypothetical protein
MLWGCGDDSVAVAILLWLWLVVVGVVVFVADVDDFDQADEDEVDEVTRGVLEEIGIEFESKVRAAVLCAAVLPCVCGRRRAKTTARKPSSHQSNLARRRIE